MKTNSHVFALALLTWASVVGVAWAHGAADAAGGSGDHSHMWGGWGWDSMFMGPLFGIILIPVIAVAIVLVVRAIGSGGSTDGPAGSSALDILDERFARGEIDAQEYEDRKRVLTGG